MNRSLVKSYIFSPFFINFNCAIKLSVWIEDSRHEMKEYRYLIFLWHHFSVPNYLFVESQSTFLEGRNGYPENITNVTRNVTGNVTQKYTGYLHVILKQEGMNYEAIQFLLGLFSPTILLILLSVCTWMICLPLIGTAAMCRGPWAQLFWKSLTLLQIKSHE